MLAITFACSRCGCPKAQEMVGGKLECPRCGHQGRVSGPQPAEQVISRVIANNSRGLSSKGNQQLSLL